MKLNGAEILINCLKKEGVKHIFGYPGGAVLHIYDALEVQEDITHVLVRHEQGAAHAADGYARTSGKPGVVLVTSGPGITNAVTGIATANMDSIPMVVISGQVPSPLIGNDAFQEVDAVGIIHKGEDEALRETVEKRNSLDSIIYQGEKLLSENADKLSEQDTEPVKAAIEAARKDLDSDDLAKLDASHQRVEQELHKLAETLYKSEAPGEGEAAAPGQGAEAPDATAGAANDDDIVDAEYTEEKGDS